jgi:nucleotide-binding universal stress UspA family protein
MRIICAVDGSEYSQWGVQTLQALAGQEPEEVTLVHVIEKNLLTGKSQARSVDKQALKAMEKVGQLILRNAERSAKVALGQAATGPKTTLRRVLAFGPIASTIVRRQRTALDVSSCDACGRRLATVTGRGTVSPRTGSF